MHRSIKHITSLSRNTCVKSRINDPPLHASCLVTSPKSNYSASNLPSATFSESSNDPYAFRYHSKDGLPVPLYNLPGTSTLEGILEEYKDINPFALIKPELDDFSEVITKVIESQASSMTSISRYLLDAQGKRFRPAITLLLSKALAVTPNSIDTTLNFQDKIITNYDPNVSESTDTTVNYDFLSSDVYRAFTDYRTNLDLASSSSTNTTNTNTNTNTNTTSSDTSHNSKFPTPTVLPSACFATLPPVIENIQLTDSFSRQKKLAQILELIHVASLYHDDVIDNANTRRGQPSANIIYGNRNAVLSGVYLLARASLILCKIKNHAVTHLVSTIMDNLVKGEVLQMKDQRIGKHQHLFTNLDNYICKSFYKTSSLLTNGCHGVAILGNHTVEYQNIAREYGQYIGIAFQLIDDILDFTVSSHDLGKPGMNDLKQGIATAPVLYAADMFPELYDLIDRKFSNPGDIEYAMECIDKAQGIEKARILAHKCGEAALAAVLQLEPSPSRDALISLVAKVLYRKK